MDLVNINKRLEFRAAIERFAKQVQDIQAKVRYKLLMLSIKQLRIGITRSKFLLKGHDHGIPLQGKISGWHLQQAIAVKVWGHTKSHRRPIIMHMLLIYLIVWVFSEFLILLIFILTISRMRFCILQLEF